MSIERYIDYAAFSSQTKEDEFRTEEYSVMPPVQFYSRGYRGKHGERIYFGNPNSKKAFWVLSGQALENMRSYDKTDAELLQRALSSGAKFSRLDLAVTEFIEDELITLWEVQRWYELGLIESSLCKYGGKLIEAIPETGDRAQETFYIGDQKKRGKLGIFRAYDKGIEWQLPKELITRLELEMRGKKANNTAKRIAETNDIAGNFRASFNVHHSSFHRLMDADAVSVSRGRVQEREEETKEQEKRWLWLMKQVAPALKKAIAEDEKSGKGLDNLNLFLTKVGILGRAKKPLFDKLLNDDKL